jgi:DNA-binding transcriptional LysR family regulator
MSATIPKLHVTLKQIEAFVVCVEMHSFTAAAAALNLTPSAVSQLVSELESSLGFKLFSRTTRAVNLSSAGREFLPNAQALMRERALAGLAAYDIVNRAVGVVRVAAPLTIAATLLPDLIAQYIRDKPKLIVRIVDCAVEGLVDAVVSGQVDLALGPDRPTGKKVQSHSLFASAWVLWCAASHPLALAPRVRWSQLGAYPIIAAGRDHETQVSKMMPSQKNTVIVPPRYIVDNITTALGMAKAQLGVTLAPEYISALALPMGLVMRPVIAPSVIRQVSLYESSESAGMAPSPVVQGFAEFIKMSLRA